VCDRYLESKVNIRPTTRRGYDGLIEVYLRPYFADWKAQEVSAANVERLRTELAAGVPPRVADALARRYAAAKPGLSEARATQRATRKRVGIRTINKCLTLLAMIFNYAHKHGLVDRNPAKHVEKIRTAAMTDAAVIDANVLSPAEVGSLIAAAETARRDKNGKLISNNYRLVVKTAVLTGLRQGELLGLQWGDVDWLSKQFFVRRAYKEGAFVAPKTPKSVRRVDLPQSLVAELKEWRLACPKGEHDLIFPNLEGEPMSHANLTQRGFHPALRRAGLRRIRFHDLRHTFASLLIANGEDVVRVSRLLGHASTSITLNVYSHMLPKDHYGSADRLADMVTNASVGNKLETSVTSGAAVPMRHRAEAKRDQQLRVVARGGIEPPTRGFSVRCSTN
jgi:integrase